MGGYQSAECEGRQAHAKDNTGDAELNQYFYAMYVPKLYRNDDAADIKGFIKANSFAALVNTVGGRPWATHTPLVLTDSGDGKEVLFGHISRANPQWKVFAEEQEVMAIFNGPHAYISSSWYDHENVPTWNYIAVHVYGRLRMVEGDELWRHMAALVDKYEAGLPNPVSLDEMDPVETRKEMRGIVGFEIEITEIQAVTKLSQNRDAHNKQLIIDGLEQKGDADSLTMAEILKGRQ